MIRQNWLVLGLLGLLLSSWGCTYRYVVPKEKMEDSTFTYTRNAVIAFISPVNAESDVFVGQKFWTETTEMNLITPGDTNFFYTKRRDQQTFLVKWWEPNGWHTDEFVQSVERPGRESDTVWVMMDDNFLRDIVLQYGYVINSTPWPIFIWDDRGNHYELIYPSGSSRKTGVAPGPIIFFFQRENDNHVYKANFIIDRERKDNDFGTTRVDWVAPLVIRR